MITHSKPSQIFRFGSLETYAIVYWVGNGLRSIFDVKRVRVWKQ